MRKKFKLFTVAIATLFTTVAISLVGCGGSSTTTPTGTENNTNSTSSAHAESSNNFSAERTYISNFVDSLELSWETYYCFSFIVTDNETDNEYLYTLVFNSSNGRPATTMTKLEATSGSNTGTENNTKSMSSAHAEYSNRFSAERTYISNFVDSLKKSELSGSRYYCFNFILTDNETGNKYLYTLIYDSSNGRPATTMTEL